MQVDKYEALTEKLMQLVVEACARAKQYRDTGSLEARQEQFARQIVNRLDYHGEHIMVNLELQAFDKSVWAAADKQRFIVDFLKNCARFDEILSACQDRESVTNDVRRFLNGILGRAHSQDFDVDQSSLRQRCTVLASELTGREIAFTSIAYLGGIWLTDADEIPLGDRLRLRRMRKQDYEAEGVLGRLPVFGQEFNHCVTAAMELRVTAKFGSWPMSILSVATDVLRLFRLGSITCVQFKTDPHVGIGGMLFTRASFPRFTYGFSKADAAAWCKLCEKMWDALWASHEQPEGGGIAVRQDGIVLDSTNHVGVAMVRYRAAILGEQPLGERLVQSISCLEALFLKSSERNELSRRLAQRTSLLLRLVGADPMSVARDLLQGYRIRSKHVHGDIINKADKARTEELCLNILDFARKALQVFLQLRIDEKRKKEELLDRLDNAMLSSGEQEDLLARFSTNVFIT